MCMHINTHTHKQTHTNLCSWVSACVLVCLCVCTVVLMKKKTMWARTAGLMSSQWFSHPITANLQCNSIWIKCSLYFCTFCPMWENIHIRKRLRTGILPTQRSGVVVHKLKFVFVSTLELSSFLRFRRSFPLCFEYILKPLCCLC